MPDLVTELAERGRSLPPEERVRLLDLLLESLPLTLVRLASAGAGAPPVGNVWIRAKEALTASRNFLPVPLRLFS